MAILQVYLSRAGTEKRAAEYLATALREAGADVWFDETPLGDAQDFAELKRQIAARPIFIVLLSRVACSSERVRREVQWAEEAQRRDSTRATLPIVAAEFDRAALLAFKAMPTVASGMRLSADGLYGFTPLPREQMVAETLRLLALSPAGQQQRIVMPQPDATLDELLLQGAALAAQERWLEAQALFWLATERAPENARAWGEFARMTNELERCEECLPAYERALQLDPTYVRAWNGLAVALSDLKRYDESLAAFDQALRLNPTYVFAWNNKGNTLYEMGRYLEALNAFDQAVALKPDNAIYWGNRANAFYELRRYLEALNSYNHSLSLDPSNPVRWYGKATALFMLRRYNEALAACDHALALDANDAVTWNIRSAILTALGRDEDAAEAKKRAEELSAS